MRKRRLDEEDLQFDALSYAWGKEKCPRKVLLDGHHVSIGLNLERALCELRRSYSGRLLWIDALCINQEDVKERSQQVQLMGRIFSSAEQVII